LGFAWESPAGGELVGAKRKRKRKVQSSICFTSTILVHVSDDTSGRGSSGVGWITGTMDIGILTWAHEGICFPHGWWVGGNK